jgi:hypothetical protein
MMRRKQAIKARTLGCLRFTDIKNYVRNTNYPCSDHQIRATLREYADLGVLQLDDDDNTILEGRGEEGEEDGDLEEALDAVQFPGPPVKRTIPAGTRLTGKKKRRVEAEAEEVEAEDGEAEEQ